MNFKITLSISAKKAVGILIRMTLNLQIALHSIAILTILSLHIHEPEMFSHYLDLYFFQHCLQGMPCISLVMIYSKIFYINELFGGAVLDLQKKKMSRKYRELQYTLLYFFLQCY